MFLIKFIFPMLWEVFQLWEWQGKEFQQLWKGGITKLRWRKETEVGKEEQS